jgi:hypothetical protein
LSDSLLAKLKAGKRNTNTIKFPGTDSDVALRILTEAERQESVFAAENHFKKKKIEYSVATSDEMEMETDTQILFRALRNPDNLSKSLAGSADELRGMIEENEKQILISQYIAFEQECSPNPKQLDAEELDSLIEGVKKNPEMIIGSVSNIVIARQLITILVKQLAISPKDNGSTSL